MESGAGVLAAVDPATVGDSLGLPAIEPTQVAIGAGVAVVGLLLSRLSKLGSRWWWARSHTASYARVFSAMVGFFVALVAIGIGLAVAFPSVRPVDLLGGIGVVSIALGIAFQSVLSNLFAGVLILVREPFRANDQIAVGDVAGTVVEVNLRETVVRTFDGRRVLVPNSTVHGEVLTVQTGYSQIRTSVVVGVDYATDLDRARQIALQAVRDVDGVLSEPAPECLLVNLSPSTVDFEVRFWSGARQLNAVETRDRVIEAAVTALSDAGVALPADIRQLEAGPSLQSLLRPDQQN